MNKVDDKKVQEILDKVGHNGEKLGNFIKNLGRNIVQIIKITLVIIFGGIATFVAGVSTGISNRKE